MEVSFYHLLTQDVSIALPRLLAKAYAAAKRVLVFSRDENQMREVDEWLWTYDKASFLPHGTDRNKFLESQPILISCSVDPVNQADILVILDGYMPADISGFSRCLYMFDGRDEPVVEQAREHWKQFTTSDHQLVYWKQDARGGWQKAHERGSGGQ
ncbi:MAG: DNA polymerase III subunit chi [Pseudomonadota bacterium]